MISLCHMTGLGCETAGAIGVGSHSRYSVSRVPIPSPYDVGTEPGQ